MTRQNSSSDLVFFLHGVADGNTKVVCRGHGRKLGTTFSREFVRELHTAHATPRHNRLLGHRVVGLEREQLLQTSLNVVHDAGQRVGTRPIRDTHVLVDVYITRVWMRARGETAGANGDRAL